MEPQPSVAVSYTATKSVDYLGHTHDWDEEEPMKESERKIIPISRNYNLFLQIVLFNMLISLIYYRK